MKLKRTKDFLKINENADPNSEELWIYEDEFEITFEVTKDMVKDGMMIKGKIPDVVKCNFNCSFVQLTTLKNCPKEIYGSFWCNDNKLTSLEFGPTKVDGHYNCEDNLITSLKYCPKEIDGNFRCSGNKITSLKHCPEIINGDLRCNDNKLTSLEFAPKKGIENVRTDSNIFDLEIENYFIKKGYTNYYQDLYKYCKDNGKNISDIKSWPEEFVKTLPEEDKRILTSDKGISKFDL